jgi:hypothetical protein
MTMKPMERFPRDRDMKLTPLPYSALSAIKWQSLGLLLGWSMDTRGFVFIDRPVIAEETPLFVLAARAHNDAKMARARGSR